MHCEVHGSAGIATPSITDHVMNCIDTAVGRFADRVSRVRVRLEDINGPRGGADKQCTVDISLIRGGHIIIRELHDDLYAAISIAADRTKSVVSRRIARRRAA